MNRYENLPWFRNLEVENIYQDMMHSNIAHLKNKLMTVSNVAPPLSAIGHLTFEIVANTIFLCID